MLALIRALLAPLFSLILMNLGCGLFNTYVSVRLDIQGYSADAIGVVCSALYVGVLIGSLYLSRWISRVGHTRAFVVFALISASLMLGHAFWIDAWYWSVLRAGQGVCLAGIFIVVESWCLLQSAPELRGRALSIYLAAFYLALSAGQFFIGLTPLVSIVPFCLTAFLVGSSVLPMKMAFAHPPPIQEERRIGLIEMFHLSPIGFWGGIVSGSVLGAVYGLTPVYAVTQGLSVFEIGTTMAVLIFGGLSFQWWMGYLADKTGRRRVLRIACWGAAAFALLIGGFGGFSWILLLILIWFFGGFSFTIYPLSMAYLCENMESDKIVAVTGGFVLCYALGAIAGPLLAPLAMDLLGPAGLFYFLALITGLLGVFTK